MKFVSSVDESLFSCALLIILSLLLLCFCDWLLYVGEIKFGPHMWWCVLRCFSFVLWAHRKNLVSDCDVFSCLWTILLLNQYELPTDAAKRMRMYYVRLHKELEVLLANNIYHCLNRGTFEILREPPKPSPPPRSQEARKKSPLWIGLKAMVNWSRYGSISLKKKSFFLQDKRRVHQQVPLVPANFLHPLDTQEDSFLYQRVNSLKISWDVRNYVRRLRFIRNLTKVLKGQVHQPWNKTFGSTINSTLIVLA